ncbi:MAG: sigma 54-interacting transcriptional regulator [Verrucomicrobiota bacterium]
MNRSPGAASSSDFWLAAARVAFANPFSEEFPASAPRVEAEFAQRISRLDQAGATHLRRYRAEERATMRTVFLFDACRRFSADFDKLIVAQSKKEEGSLPVPFANDLLGLLSRRGIEGGEAVRALGIFFQIRRAHHFIAGELIGQSASMRRLRRDLWNNVFTHDMHFYERSLWNRMDDFSTLLSGETGTGKATVAAAIARSGFIPFDEKKRAFAESFTRGFLPFNLSQYPAPLIEFELFGNPKGAGANEAHEGVFTRCSPFGAVFLDEIDQIPPPLQVKLLRVLQERVFSPVGSRDLIPFRGRVIAATDKPIEKLRGREGLRDDLYYRLCSDAIILPTLRARLAEDRQELDGLLSHLIARMGGDPAGALLPLVRSALGSLLDLNYAWPGNVRELEQAVRRIILTRRYPGETSEVPPDDVTQLNAGVSAGSLNAEELLSRYCALLYSRCGNLEEVARRTDLDRRTVKRYLAQSGLRK